MTENLSLVFYYHRLNCYSFNALAAAMDRDAGLAALPVSLIPTGDAVLDWATQAANRSERVVVAISIMTCQMEEARTLIARLREKLGNKVLVAAGGPHATACPEEVLAAGADIVFRGEAEFSFPAVLKNLVEGQDVRGVQDSPSPVCLDAFMSISPPRGMFGPIEITRGCVFACNYCQTSRIFGVKLRHRGIDNIAAQAAALRSGHRKIVRLLSPNAFSYGSPDGRSLNLTALRDLLATLRRTVTASGKILFAHFPSEARPEHVTHETLSLLREFADNDEIVIGAQSGSGRMLEACNRDHSVENILSAVSLARKYGYKVIVDFIYGLPGETEEDRRSNFEAMEEVVCMGGRIHPHIFAPLPGTPFAKAPPGSLDPCTRELLERFAARGALYYARSQKPGLRVQNK